MRINNIGYLLKEGVRGIFQHRFMSFAAVIITVACLLIMGSFSILTYNVNLIVDDLNQTNEVMVYVDETYSDQEAASVGTSLNMVDNVYNAVPVSKEEALEQFEKDYGHMGVQKDDLRFRFRVVLEDNSLMRQTVAEIEKIPGVANISAPYELAEKFASVEQVLQMVSAVMILALLVVSLLLISNTIKMAMYHRQKEISIMKMVGATNGFIRIPFMVQGFLLGMVGASVAFGLEWLIYDMLINHIQDAGLREIFPLVPFKEILVPMICIFGAAGLFVSVMGSWPAIRKFMNAPAK